MPRQHLAALQGQRPGGAGTSQHTDCTQRQRQPESLRPFRVSFASQACITASQQPAHTATTPASAGPGLRNSPGRVGLRVNVFADAVLGVCLFTHPFPTRVTSPKLHLGAGTESGHLSSRGRPCPRTSESGPRGSIALRRDVRQDPSLATSGVGPLQQLKALSKFQSV